MQPLMAAVHVIGEPNGGKASASESILCISKEPLFELIILLFWKKVIGLAPSSGQASSLNKIMY